MILGPLSALSLDESDINSAYEIFEKSYLEVAKMAL
jgi:hypothetical protein